MAKYRATGSVNDLPRTPRGRATTRRQDRFIEVSHMRNRRLRATQTARVTIGTHGRPISSQTVRNRLRSQGIRARRPFNGIILTQQHRRQRLLWARRHSRVTMAEWARILFTDEVKIRLHGNDGRGRVYRRRGERFSDACVHERDRFGGASVLIWAGISMYSKTPVVEIRGTLTAARYQNEILQPVCIPHLRGNRLRLMQDGATSHTALGTRNMLTANRVNVMPWPSRSPDLNPLENFWDVLKQRVALRNPQNRNQLLQYIINEWQNIPQNSIRNYIMSMPSRCRAVIRARGGHTAY